MQTGTNESTPTGTQAPHQAAPLMNTQLVKVNYIVFLFFVPQLYDCSKLQLAWAPFLSGNKFISG